MTHFNEWTKAPLGEVCKVNPRCDPLSSDAPFLPMAAIEVGSRTPRFFEPRGSRSGARAAGGDLLFARITPCLENGKVAVVPAELEAVGGSTEFIVVRPGPAVLSEWLYYWSLTGEVRQAAESRMTGTTGRMRLPPGELAALPMAVPPLGEQRRIVEILEDHLSRLDAAGANVKSCRIRAQGWRRSAIDRVVWRMGAAGTVAVSDLLAEKMRNGHSARASTTGAGVRALTLTSVTRNSFTEACTKVVAVEADRVRDLWLRDGDIFVQRSNTPELVGTTAIYRGPNDWAIFPDLLIRLRANKSRVSPGYLAAAMRTERVHGLLRTQAKGLAGSMPKIDQAAIGSVLVPVPSLPVQENVVSRVAEIDDGYSRLISEVQAVDHRVQSLRRALMAAAFSGRLTA